MSINIAYYLLGLFTGSVITGAFLCIFIGKSCDR